MKEAALLSESERATKMTEINNRYKDRLEDVLTDNTTFTTNLQNTIKSLYNGTDTVFPGLDSSL
jgi:hypothetical protein